MLKFLSNTEFMENAIESGACWEFCKEDKEGYARAIARFRLHSLRFAVMLIRNHSTRNGTVCATPLQLPGPERRQFAIDGVISNRLLEEPGPAAAHRTPTFQLDCCASIQLHPGESCVCPGNGHPLRTIRPKTHSWSYEWNCPYSNEPRQATMPSV